MTTLGSVPLDLKPDAAKAVTHGLLQLVQCLEEFNLSAALAALADALMACDYGATVDTKSRLAGVVASAQVGSLGCTKMLPHAG